MRAAFLNRNPHTHPGGDNIMLERLMSALRLLGVECENIYGEWQPEHLHAFDVVIIYHLNFSWSADNFRKAQQSGKPIVSLPIFYPTDILGQNHQAMRRCLESARMVCPLSFTEAREILRLTGFAGPFTIIPHGTEERFHYDGSGREFVMAVNARGDKGERLVEQACERLGLPFRYVTRLSHEELHLVYRKAKVFVHASLDDRMSLTVVEALCAGCRVLSSVHDRGNEWFPRLRRIDPQNPRGLEEAIRDAWEGRNWDYGPNIRAREMTWGKAAEAWRRVFERIVA